MSADAPWRRVDSGALILTLHVQPAAGHTQVLGVHGDALKIKVAAPPVDGKANDALLQFIAEAFGVPLRQVTLVRGQTSRAKVVRVNALMLRPDLGWT